MNRKGELRNLIIRTELARKRRLGPVWTEMGLTAGQPRVLGQLFVKDHITQKELSDFSDIDPARLSRILDKLEVMGYVSRKENPGCRRSYLIVLTEAGREKAGAVRAVFTEIENRMLDGFTEEEMEVLLGLMGRICENLR